MRRGLCVVVLAACSSVTAADAPWVTIVFDDAPAFHPDAVAIGCVPDVAPSLDACVSGHFFADCGGLGPPRLACKADDCRWFTTSCVAAEFIPSPCSPADICCLGDWPLETPLNLGSSEALFRRLYAYGLQPWDRSRALAVDVVVDESLLSPAPGFHCNGPDPFPDGSTPCTTASPSVFMWTDETLPGFLLAIPGFPAGWGPVAAIDPALMKASICTYRQTDAGSPHCHGIAEPVCASSGTLTLKRLSPTAAGFDPVAWKLDVQMGDLHLTGSF